MKFQKEEEILADTFFHLTLKKDLNIMGIVSIPSSDIENPYKLASPYEFFIVQSKNGAYHLDKDFTPFGKVIKGMEVVDIISNLETDRREWPHENVKIEVEILN